MYKVCNVFVTTSEKVEKSMIVEGSENMTSAFPAELLLNINFFSQQFSNQPRKWCIPKVSNLMLEPKYLKEDKTVLHYSDFGKSASVKPMSLPYLLITK